MTNQKVFNQKPSWLLVAGLFAMIVSLAGCGGGSDDGTATSIPTDSSTISKPRPISTESIQECLTLGNKPFSMILSTGMSGTKSELIPSIRTTTEPIEARNASEKTYKRSNYFVESQGGSQITEEIFAATSAGLINVSRKHFGAAASAAGEIKWQDGANLDIPIETEKSYTNIFSGKIIILNMDQTVTESRHSKLLAMESLTTKAKVFPTTCKIELTSSIPITSGGTSDSKSIVWVAPYYGVVRTDLYLPGGNVLTTVAHEITVEPI